MLGSLSRETFQQIQAWKIDLKMSMMILACRILVKVTLPTEQLLLGSSSFE